MWDTISNDHAYQRAESNSRQLQDEVFNGLIHAGKVVRFTNTMQSTLQIMDALQCISVTESRAFSQPNSLQSHYLFQDLVDRIESAIVQKGAIALDLADPEAQTNALLRSILERNQAENEHMLDKLVEQLTVFGPPSAEFNHAMQLLQNRIAAATEVPVFAPDIGHDQLFQQWHQQPYLDVRANHFGINIWDHNAVPRSRVVVLKGLLRRFFNVVSARGRWLKGIKSA